MKKIILDVDTGIDDAIAIMLAVASKEIEILGISVTSGNIHVDQGIINTKKILKVLGREDIKVYRGSAEPMKRTLVDASHIHGKDGLSGQLAEVMVSSTSDGCAFDFLEESINTYEDALTIIMTGPETNIAKLLKKKPNLQGKIKNLIAMGGAINLKGNATLVGEFNIVTDPEAAYDVFHAGIEHFTLLSLDVTRDALINKDELEDIKDLEVRKIVTGLTENYMDRYFLGNGTYSCLMHDPLTILYFLDRTLVETRKEYVTIERTGEYTYGMTLCDFSGRLGQDKNINISIALNVDAFKDKFFELMNQLKIS
jgi:purine nucleosidase